ncbi:MAG TPA: nicotinate-nucleotide--dimethylbenzimidazole phosphoribosyltransferase, partial [Clostridia bacterium]|nr:nicotinate-nucleotide--dimethylbenzimidazole phosphoribosyltransferase [Clostridia bacterium]
MNKTKDLAHGELLTKVKSRIARLDEDSMEKTSRRLDSLTKPPGSLGALEDIAMRLAGIRGNPLPEIRKKVNIIMVGD